jgi:hypothetical protein
MTSQKWYIGREEKKKKKKKVGRKWSKRGKILSVPGAVHVLEI